MENVLKPCTCARCVASSEEHTKWTKEYTQQSVRAIVDTCILAEELKSACTEILRLKEVNERLIRENACLTKEMEEVCAECNVLEAER